MRVEYERYERVSESIRGVWEEYENMDGMRV